MKLINAFKNIFSTKTLPSNVPIIIYGKKLFITDDNLNSFFSIKLELLKRGYREFKQDDFGLYFDAVNNCIKEDINYKL